MSALDQTFFRSAKILAVQSATNGVATATVAATERVKTLVTAIAISANGQPGAAAEASLTVGATTVPIQIPAAAFALIFINFAQAPLESDYNEAVSVSVPALGASVKCSVAVFGKRIGS